MRRKQRFGDRTLGMPDRRAAHRFPLHLAIKYRKIGPPTLSEWTLSESVNISSGGLFFKTPEPLTPGQALEVMVSWPVLLDKHIPLRLVTKGPVVRNVAGGTAMRFETYEFRTSQISAETHAAASAELRAEAHNRPDSNLKIAG